MSSPRPAVFKTERENHAPHQPIVVIRSYRSDLAKCDDNINISVTPKNTQTRLLFNKVLSLLADGYLPFQGTQDLIEYEIHLSSPRIKPGLIDQLYHLLGWGESEECKINFPDAPGGALFAGDDEEVDDVVMGDFRRTIVQKLQTAHGLIICVDSSVLQPGKEAQKHLRSVALAFTRWLPDIFAEVVQDKEDSKLVLKRVCFVLTKSDLWAQQNDLEDVSQAAVQNRDPYIHAKEILGQIFFNSIRKYFTRDIEVAFCMSSIYGFLDGKPHSGLIEASEQEDSDDFEGIAIQDWAPYNVIEPFIFLLNGDNIDERIKILNWDEVGS